MKTYRIKLTAEEREKKKYTEELIVVKGTYNTRRKKEKIKKPISTGGMEVCKVFRGSRLTYLTCSLGRSLSGTLA